MSAGEAVPPGPARPPGPAAGGAVDPAILDAEIMAQIGALGAEQDTGGVDQRALGGYYDPEFFGTEIQVPGMRQAVPRGVPSTRTRDFYVSGDEWREMQGLNPEATRALADRLMAVGLMDEYRGGSFEGSGAMIDAMRNLLTLSNRRGTFWKQTLGDFEEAIAAGTMEPIGEDSDLRRVKAFEQLPDYDSLKARVIRHFQDRLGRDPNEAEMRLFTEEMMTGFEEQAQRDYREQTDFREIGQDVGAGRVPTEASRDPYAEFELSFRERMGSQIETLEQQEGAATGSQAAAATLAGSDQAARGPGTQAPRGPA